MREISSEGQNNSRDFEKYYTAFQSFFSDERYLDSKNLIESILAKTQDDLTKHLILAKTLFDLYEANKTFNVKNPDRGLLKAKEKAFSLLHLQNKTQENIFGSSAFFDAKRNTSLKLDNDARDALRLFEIKAYCDEAHKATKSSATQKSIESFTEAMNDTGKNEKATLAFYSKAIENFSTGDAPLKLLQEKIISICKNSIPPGRIMEFETKLANINKINNRLKHVPDEIITKLIRAETSATFESNKSVIRSAKQAITDAQDDIKASSPEKLAEIVKNLRETRRRHVSRFTRNNVAPTSLMETIETLALPYVSSSKFNAEQIKTFVAIFEHIPFSSQFWLPAYENIINNFGQLNSADKLKVIRTSVLREQKRSVADPRIMDLIVRAQMTPGTAEAKELQIEITKHNSHIKQYFHQEENLAVRELKIPEQDKNAIGARYNLSTTKDLFALNLEKAQKAKHEISELMEFGLRNKFDEKNIPDTLEGRRLRLEELLKPLAFDDDRKVLDHLVERGKEAIILEKKRNTIAKLPESELFYNTLLRGIITILLAARVIASGDVARRHQSSHVASVAVSFLGEILSAPVISGLLNKTANVIEFAGQYHVERTSDILNDLTTTNTGLELFAEKITLELTDLMGTDLAQYESESVEKIAHHCKERFKSLFAEFPEKAEEKNLDVVANRYVHRITKPTSSKNSLAAIFKKIYAFFASPLIKKAGAPDKTPVSIPDLLGKIRPKKEKTPPNKNTVSQSYNGNEPSPPRLLVAKDKDEQVHIEDLLEIIVVLQKKIKDLELNASKQAERIRDLEETTLEQEKQIRALELKLGPKSETKIIENATLKDETLIIPLVIKADKEITRLKKHVATLTETVLRLGKELTKKDLAEVELLESIPDDKMISPINTLSTPGSSDPFEATPLKSLGIYANSNGIKTPFVQKTLQKNGEERKSALRDKRIKLECRDIVDGVFLNMQTARNDLTPFKLGEQEQDLLEKTPFALANVKPEDLEKDPDYIPRFKELLKTEKSFCKDLNHLCSVFVGNQNELKPLLGDENFQAIQERIYLIMEIAENPFAGLKPETLSAKNFHEILQKFDKIFSNDQFISRIAESITICQDYILLSHLLSKGNAEHIFTKSQMDGKPTGKNASALLSTLFQRAPRYVLLLQDIKKGCLENTELQALADKNLRIAQTYTELFNRLQTDIPSDKAESKLSRNNCSLMWRIRKSVVTSIKEINGCHDASEQKAKRGPSRAVAKLDF